VVEVVGLSSDDFPISKSSIQQICTETRKSRAEAIKSDFQNIHRHNPLPGLNTRVGQLLPGLDIRSSKEECLPVIALFHGRE